MDSEGLLLLNSVVKMKRRIISDPSCFVQTIREMHRCIIIRIAHVLCLSYRDEPVLSHDDGKYRVMRMLWGIGTPYPGTIIFQEYCPLGHVMFQYRYSIKETGMQMKKILLIPVYSIASLIVLYIIWLCARVFLFDYFTVPSSSMTPTILPGDVVIVNKTIFGPRLYTDLHFDVKGQELQSERIKGMREIKINDIVIFNFPIHGHKISFRINHVYCKRVVALPGDSVRAVCGHIINNNHDGILGSLDKQKQLESKSENDLIRYNVNDVYPREEHFPWTIQNWGPLYIPRKGDIINVTPREAILYRKILEWETGATVSWDWERNKVYAGKSELCSHTFSHNYYHICGDYSLDSYDSRYWGLVPEEYIVGVVDKIIRDGKMINPYIVSDDR